MSERQFHIQCTAEDIGKYVFLPGDPGRTEWIASYLEHPVKTAQNREFTTLAALGAHTFLRIGTCGGMQPELIPGTLIIPTGAIRMEGTSQEYVPLAFPAVPDFGLTQHLVCAAQELAYDYRTGVVQCKDSFYGQHSPETMPAAQTLLQNWQAWKAAGALASEMESAALFIVAATRRVKCATILQMLWNQERQAVVRDNAHAAGDMTHAIEVAVSAMRREIRQGKKEEM